jgi:hypothetical protein
MELTEIKSKGISWGQAAQSLNNNFEKIGADVEKLKYSTSKVKGFFRTSAELNSLVKSANNGEIAYVGDSSPYQIWEWRINKWIDTGVTEGSINVNMANYYDKNEVDSLIKDNVFDGGRADSVYGGSMVIDCGTAYHS